MGTTIMDAAGGLPISSTSCPRGGSHAGRNTRSCPDPAELPPLPGAAEGLPLGEMSIRGEFVVVGAGEFVCDQNVVLAS
jgi:hypothetical protein